jgi:four helix bundle protein
MPFNHENLKVYQRTLPFNVKVAVWTGQWDSRHAICDPLPRAAGSMLENIAMASAAYSSMKLRGLDYAIGSSLECAACLHLALIKRLLDAESASTEKEELSQIMRMLVGLRKSWASTDHVVREGSEEYSTQGKGIDTARDRDSGDRVLFHHETLDVYRISIKAVMTASMIADIQP